MASSLSDCSLSDSELPPGLPSPQASDDEDASHGQDLGIVVPNFCNKLRTMTRHLFPKPEVVVLSDLCGEVIAKVKSEPKKKATIKDEVDVPRKPMVSHSNHHHASPRWDTKSPSTRSYDPCDITGGDELEVAGVLFRSWTAGRDKQQQQQQQQNFSKTDSDFPSLNESSLSERSVMSKSNDASILGISSGGPRNKAWQSPSSITSPVTSTPHNKSKNHSMESSLLRNPESPLCGNQSFNKSDPKSNSKSGSKGNRRRSKKLPVQTSSGDLGIKSPLESSPAVDVNANNRLHSKNLSEGQTNQRLDFDGNLRNPPLVSRKSKQQPPAIANEASVENRPASPWNQIVKSSSPRLSPILRIDSPKTYQTHPDSKEEPKPVEIIRKREESSKILSIDKSSGLRTPGCGKKKNKERVHRAQLMSVDNGCVAPQKKNEAETWSSASNTAFENRFVERIAVSGTSPPKKVNPSPIKKLDFSHRKLDNSSTTSGEIEIKPPGKADSVFKRQVSLISDLNWKKNCPGDQSSKENNRGNTSRNNHNGGRDRNGRNKRAVFSLEDFVTTQEVSKLKDEIVDVETGEGKGSGSAESKSKTEELKVNKSSGKTEEAAAHGSGVHISVSVDVKLVTGKAMLKVMAQRYCYYVEGNYVASLPRDLLFIIQLLTSSQENCMALTHNNSTNLFESIHNCVYFAVVVMKRLKRLFCCLPRETISLLAMNNRVKMFSSKLHEFFKACVMPKEKVAGEENLTPGKMPNALCCSQNWSSSFSDVKMVHAFKCQRDNFFALYKRYQDADKDHPFPMEEQVHYVYNPQISEHKSVANLMHLAQLFLDLLLQSSIQHSNSQVNYLEMVLNRKSGRNLLQKQLEQWKEANSCLTMGSPPRWSRNELFFKDFWKAIRCPAFDEILKNVIVSKILELNNIDFDVLMNLHSSVCVPDDMTPQRCEKFTNTGHRLCILAKFLGLMAFESYAGAEDLSPEENDFMMAVREMTPLPLPLPMILRNAKEKGHLCLTVPWVCHYLSMMDAGAVKLTAYSHVINQLCSIQRHAWKRLFCEGYHNTGLLITCSISWLFENPMLPAGLIYSQPNDSETKCVSARLENKTLDTQRLVTSHLLYSCCPHLNACHIPLVLYALHKKATPSIRSIVPLTNSAPPMPAASTAIPHPPVDKDMEELCQWLGLSLAPPAPTSGDTCGNSDGSAPVPEGETITPSTCHPVFTSTKNSLNELTRNFVQCHPYLGHCIHQSVDTMCGKVQDYAINTLVKLAVFQARVKVRQKFTNMDAGEDATSVKGCILAKANVMADKLSLSTQQAFFQTGEKVCQTELPNLIDFLASHKEESIRKTSIDIAQKAATSRLVEWAKIQLGPSVFHRVIVNEAEKVASTLSFKPVSLYPSDYMRKPEYDARDAVELSSSGFDHLQQLSKVLDTALACGSWYMNGQTRGPRPDDTFIQGMMDDFMVCIRDHTGGMDFSFSIMVNFFMHLIIQYIVDAPQNWTDACLETFISLCVLFESKKHEDDLVSFQPSESSHKAKNLKMKVTNLMSVYSLEWLAKSQDMDQSVMVYWRTLVKLIEADLVSVERVVEKLTAARVNHHLPTATRLMIDQVMVNVLELLLMSTKEDKKKKKKSVACSLEGVKSVAVKTMGNFTEWASDRALSDLQSVFGDGACVPPLDVDASC